MKVSLIKAVFCAAAVAAGLLLAGQAWAGSRIKDIVDVEGVRTNQLIGYGIVVGLSGTGDTVRNSPMLGQSMQSMMERLGVNIRDANLNSKNAAAVMVTAELPAFAAPGARMDVTVSAMGDAKSLLGGTLLVTPLLGADGNAYAVAQGTVQTGSISAGGASGSSVTKGVPTAGRISDGASVERETGFNLNDMAVVRLTLRNPDFATSSRIAAAINAQYPGTAFAQNPSIVAVKPPAGTSNMAFLTEVEGFDVDVDAPAKVVIDEVNGVIVMGENVRISKVAIAQGNLTIRVDEQPGVSQPAPFSPRPDGGGAIEHGQRRRGKGQAVADARRRLIAQRPCQRSQRSGGDPARHDLDPAGHQGRRRAASRYRGDVSMDTSALLTLQAAQTSALDAERSNATQALRANVRGGQSPLPAGEAGTSPASGRNAKLGLDFESMCLSNLLTPMFEGLQTDGPFGGGEGEAAVRSFYIDAMAKQMAQRGGLGISEMMQKQLLKLQEG